MLPRSASSASRCEFRFTIDSSLPREFHNHGRAESLEWRQVDKGIYELLRWAAPTILLFGNPKRPATSRCRWKFPSPATNARSDNKKISAPISIREEKLRVLIVESYPRWEYRYLRNALSRDPGVSCRACLFHPGLNKVGGGNKDYIKEFPKGLDELSEYDVVFLGDVGQEQGQLTTEQCRLLKGLVEYQASGLVFMPGLQGRENSLMQTELSELYPVVLDDSQPGGWGSRLPSHFELTELGRRSLLTKLADSQDENSEVWEGLPGFQWYAPVRARQGRHRCIVRSQGCHRTITAGCRCWSREPSASAKCCSWAPTARGGGEKGWKINITIGSGVRWSAGWLISATWPKAKPCGFTIRPINRS